MTARKNVQQLVDALDYLEELNDTDELSAETQAAIEDGLDDIRNGRTIPLAEYRRARSL